MILFCGDCPVCRDAAVTSGPIDTCCLDEDTIIIGFVRYTRQPVSSTITCRDVSGQTLQICEMGAAVEHIIVALLLQLGGWKHEVLALCVVDICIALE